MYMDVARGTRHSAASRAFMNMMEGCVDLLPAENTKCEHGERMCRPSTCGEHKNVNMVIGCVDLLPA